MNWWAFAYCIKLSRICICGAAVHCSCKISIFILPRCFVPPRIFCIFCISIIFVELILNKNRTFSIHVCQNGILQKLPTASRYWMFSLVLLAVIAHTPFTLMATLSCTAITLLEGTVGPRQQLIYLHSNHLNWLAESVNYYNSTNIGSLLL